MAYVETASTDPAVGTPRGRFPVLDAGLETPRAPGDADGFASTLASAMQSSRPLDLGSGRHTAQVAASSRRQRYLADSLHDRQDTPASALAGRSDDASVRQATPREPSAGSARVDRIRSSAREAARSSDGERIDPERTDRQASQVEARATQSDRGGQEASESAPSTRQVDDGHPSPAPSAEDAQLAPQPAPPESEPVMAAPTLVPSSADEPDAGLLVPVPNPLSSTCAPASNGAIAGASLASVPTDPVTPTSPSAGAALAQVALPAIERGTKTEDPGQSAARDLTGSGTSAKNGEAAAKPAGAPVDFQNLLQETGRARHGSESPRSGWGALTAKAPMAGELRLTGSESVQDLARVVRSSLSSRHSAIVLRLDPPELGQLRVDVRMHDQTLALRFQTETQAGFNALQDRLGDLKQALQQHGIQLDRVAVEFRPPAAASSDPRQADNQPSSHGTPFGGESPSGHAHGQHGGAQESWGSPSYTGEFAQPGWAPDTLNHEDPWFGAVGRPGELGVDLIA